MPASRKPTPLSPFFPSPNRLRRSVSITATGSTRPHSPADPPSSTAPTKPPAPPPPATIPGTVTAMTPSPPYSITDPVAPATAALTSPLRPAMELQLLRRRRHKRPRGRLVRAHPPDAEPRIPVSHQHLAGRSSIRAGWFKCEIGPDGEQRAAAGWPETSRSGMIRRQGWSWMPSGSVRIWIRRSRK